MGYQTVQSLRGSAWELAAKQHGVVTRGQLIQLGFHSQAIKHRLAKGRLHPIWRGVYAVGRPEITRYGRLMAAVLTCGPGAVLSHRSAAELWVILSVPSAPIDVSIPSERRVAHPGIQVHRRASLGPGDLAHRHGIPLTAPIRTLIDLAPHLRAADLERAVNEADRLGLVDPEKLRRAVERLAGQPGVAPLRALLDRHTFVLTESELERRFLPVARDAGLPPPQTQALVNGFRVDFFWPDLGLVVETDGFRYHRTPAQQARDQRRDQAHIAAGLTTLRFSHFQVRYEAGYVVATLATVVGRLRAAKPPGD
jgi:very-short-patch-repair endonuclease